MRVSGVGQYEMLGETLDDAAGEAFDKTAKLIGSATLEDPRSPSSPSAVEPTASRFRAPMLEQLEKRGDLNFSFSGLKTAVVVLTRTRALDEQTRSDVAARFRRQWPTSCCEIARGAAQERA